MARLTIGLTIYCSSSKWPKSAHVYDSTMISSQWRKLGSNWPMLFTIGVAIYFLMSAIRLPNIDVPTFSSSKDKEEPAAQRQVQEHDKGATTNTTSVVGNAKDLKFKVVGLRMEVDKKNPTQVDAKTTFEISNTTTGNVDFQPSQLVIRAVGATEKKQPKGNTPIVTVSPHVSTIVPITFSIKPYSNSAYEMIYMGTTIFTGKPF